MDLLFLDETRKHSSSSHGMLMDTEVTHCSLRRGGKRITSTAWMKFLKWTVQQGMKS